MTLAPKPPATAPVGDLGEPTPSPAARRPRLTSLDAFRGLTIAGMILVNNPGTWAEVYPPLRHAEWHGWTPTDLVFPFFVFMVGVSIPLALGGRRDRGVPIGAILGKVLWRSFALFALGLLLNGFPGYDLETLRIPGVLQRLALCYLGASLVLLAAGPRAALGSALALLVGYTAALAFVPLPGGDLGNLDRGRDLASYLDRMLLAGHLYTPDYDPEGLLSTLPAIATALLGVRAGQWVRGGLSHPEVVSRLMVSGFVACLAGLLWGQFVPINKALWTAPFVLWTAGLASLGLGLFYQVIEVDGRRAWAKPLVIFGVNPIAAYVLSGLGARLLGMVKLPNGDTLKQAAYNPLTGLGLAPIDASLAFAVLYVLLWLGVMAIFHRKGWIIRI